MKLLVIGSNPDEALMLRRLSLLDLPRMEQTIAPPAPVDLIEETIKKIKCDPVGHDFVGCTNSDPYGSPRKFRHHRKVSGGAFGKKK